MNETIAIPRFHWKVWWDGTQGEDSGQWTGWIRCRGRATIQLGWHSSRAGCFLGIQRFLQGCDSLGIPPGATSRHGHDRIRYRTMATRRLKDWRRYCDPECREFHRGRRDVRAMA